MVEGSVNNIIKLVIAVASAAIAVFFCIRLYDYFRVDSPKPFEGFNQIAVFVMLLAGLVLAGLAFLGAFLENAMLCYIALVAAVGMTLWFGYQLLRCFLKDADLAVVCDTMAYVWKGLSLGGCAALSLAVLSFILSIK